MESYEENNNSSRGGSLRVFNLLDRRRLAPLNFNSRGGGDGDDNDVIVARKLLYRKLPQQRNFKLSVLKLDGSLFDVNVGRNATVAELKVAIEELFATLPGDTHGSISWYNS
ncbi:SNRNP25 [Theobroma cacao]|nr:SNRNP25 [Theobroma cacao]